LNGVASVPPAATAVTSAVIGLVALVHARAVLSDEQNLRNGNNHVK
jgi:hypothetical protein